MAAVAYTGFRWNRSDKFYSPYIGKGAVLFNGPDGIRDHETKILDARVTGIGTISPEGTGDLDYVLRAAKGCPHPRPKSVQVGEIGWDVSSVREDHVKLWRSGHQIKQGQYRLACDLRHTHLYQNPWYPAPTGRTTNQQVTLINLNRLKHAKYSAKLDNFYGRPRSHTTSSSVSVRDKEINLAFRY